MNRRLLLSAFLSASVLGIAACDPPRSVKAEKPNKSTTAAPVVETGPALIKGEKPEDIAAAGMNSDNAVVISNAVVRLDKRQSIPALVDGSIEVIGTPLNEGTPFNRDDKTLVFESEDKDKKSPYRRLRVGDTVANGTEVCTLNDLEIRVQIEASRGIMAASDRAIRAAQDGAATIQKQVNVMKGINQGREGAVSQLELLNLEATLARYIENVATSEREKVKAEGDEKRAWALRAKHRSRSLVNGIITEIKKEPGEFVKQGEPIMEVLSTEDVKVDGILEAQFAEEVRPGLKATVEPTTPVAPDRAFGTIDHRQEVTGIAVTAHPGRPLIVSTSLDSFAIVWDAFAPAGKPRASYRLAHPVSVRSVATTGAKVAKQLVATGAENGKIRIWDVSNVEKISDKAIAEFEESHLGSVSALAFSGDGKYLASAAGREVFVWTVADGKKVYALPAEHKDSVTMVRFTPQGTLVTASRDKAMRVWKLGEKAAAVERTIDHRKGNVDTLGVSSQGGRALFDQEDGRIDLITLSNGLPIASLQNGGAAARFATLAMFSPDDSLVLTSGGDGDLKGELQLWSTPSTGGRGSETKRLVVPGRMTPTCAAFGPDGKNWFIAVGTVTGRVHVWTATTLAQQSKVRTGRVTSVNRIDARTVRVVVVTDAGTDAGSLLQDKATATIIVKPGEMAVPMSGVAAVPNSLPNAAPMGVVQAGAMAPVMPAVSPHAPTPIVTIPMPERK